MPSRQHRKQSRRKPRTGRPRAPLYAAALVAVVGAGYYLGSGGDSGTGALGKPTPSPGLDGGGPVSQQEPGAPESEEPRPGASPSAAEAAESANQPPIPQRGDGEFDTVAVPGTSRTVGKGTPLRYGVAVERGLGQDPDGFAREVEGVLADRRGWTTGGKAAFQRVDRPPYDFVVRLASPGTTDELCAKHGLDTGGEVNCSGGTDVVVNLRRWVLLTPAYQGRAAMYHALIVNHEVGHRLGYGHRGCPGPGRPAPAMMQQIKGLNGCVINAWPYDSDGRAIEGPKLD
ncbi:DUF3152 domain-containing protein [Streptomyces sp. NPDC019396]|uniref:DUF3152 domain-containing protein n=1 Tax=Streptomyces sp. NPDC019396 TaxID=3154687 RepID=UPI003408F5E3